MSTHASLALLAGAFALGCGGKSDLVDEPTSGEREALVSVAETELSIDGALLDTAPANVPLSAVSTSARPSTVARPLAKLLRAWGADVPAPCIPASAFATLDCAGLSGTALILDDDRTGSSGYAAGFRGLRVTTADPGGVVLTRTLDGSVIVHAELRGAVDLHRDLRLAIERTDAGGRTTAATAAITGTVVYGADGALTGGGELMLASQDSKRFWTRRTDPALHWNPACKRTSPESPGFDSGAAVYTDDRGNVLRVTFTSCTTWTSTLNGF